jgi:hypothetical protein
MRRLVIALAAAATLSTSTAFATPSAAAAQGWTGWDDEWAPPASAWNCPWTHPIKGNAQSGIYHLPGGQYYHLTKPEDCFATEAAARSYGYRQSRR